MHAVMDKDASDVHAAREKAGPGDRCDLGNPRTISGTDEQQIQVDAVACNGRGIARYAKGDLAVALAHFERAITLKPGYPQAFNNRGIVRQRLGDFVAALADFDQAIQLAAGYADAFNNRGTLRQAMGDLAGALADFDRAIELMPQGASAFLRYNRGTARQAFGDEAGALADFEAALAVDPDLAVAYHARGVMRHRRGDLVGALADFAHALAITPRAHAASVYHGRGGVKVTQGALRGARADYDMALKLDPGYWVAYVSRANVRYHLRDLAGYVDYRHAFALNPQGTVREILTTVADDLARDAKAVLTNCRKHLRINPNDVAALCRRGLTLLLLHRDADAERDFDEIRASLPQDHVFLQFLITAAQLRRSPSDGTRHQEPGPLRCAPPRDSRTDAMTL
jgi:tetratricopeptide (TPR) repeat protein